MQTKDLKLLASVFAASMAYSVTRYHLFKGVSWDHLPLYVANKALSLSGLLLLGVSRIQVDKQSRKHLGVAGAVMIGLHVLISFQILNRAYFPKAYLANGKMTLAGEASMLAGTVALLLTYCLCTASSRKKLSEQQDATSLIPGLGRMVLLLTALHVGFWGYSGWWDVYAWPGQLPPITLISGLAACLFLILPRPKCP